MEWRSERSQQVALLTPLLIRQKIRHYLWYGLRCAYRQERPCYRGAEHFHQQVCVEEYWKGLGPESTDLEVYLLATLQGERLVPRQALVALLEVAFRIGQGGPASGGPVESWVQAVSLNWFRLQARWERWQENWWPVVHRGPGTQYLRQIKTELSRRHLRWADHWVDDLRIDPIGETTNLSVLLLEYSLQGTLTHAEPELLLRWKPT